MSFPPPHHYEIVNHLSLFSLKHAVLAQNSVLVYYCQHLNDGKSRDTKNGGAHKLRQRILYNSKL